jgi:hypothetical protein
MQAFFLISPGISAATGYPFQKQWFASTVIREATVAFRLGSARYLVEDCGGCPHTRIAAAQKPLRAESRKAQKA